MDNEISRSLLQYFKHTNITFQLAPPYMHRTNHSERDIQTFKHSLVSGLATTDPNFPLHVCCRMIEQANITLNLMRPSNINPNVSSYASLEGNYNFNKEPLLPPGTRVLLHNKPQQLKTWDP